MRSLVVAVLALAGVVVADTPVLAQRERGGGDQAAVRNGWLFSLSAGKQRARETGKALLVVVRCVP